MGCESIRIQKGPQIEAIHKLPHWGAASICAKWLSQGSLYAHSYLDVGVCQRT